MLPANTLLANAATIVVAVIFIMILLFCLGCFLLISKLFHLWLQARLSEAPVSFNELIGMRLRKIDTRAAVYSHIMAKKAGLAIDLQQLERHALAGGSSWKVVEASVLVDRKGLGLSWEKLCEIDLSGEDPYEHAAALAKS